MAPSFFVIVSLSREVESVTASSVDCMVHFVAGQLSLITTKSVRLGNVAVGEYSTRTIASEQTWIFNVPVPMEKTTPSASCWNLRTGFIGLHCAAARGVKRALTAIANRKKHCGISLLSR